jgi:hypothetical protein
VNRNKYIAKVLQGGNIQTLLDVTEQANVSAKQKFEKYVSIENKNKSQTRNKDQTRKKYSQGCVGRRYKKVYHYHNKEGEDMVEVHANWLNQYDEAKKLPNGILPLP